MRCRRSENRGKDDASAAYSVRSAVDTAIIKTIACLLSNPSVNLPSNHLLSNYCAIIGMCGALAQYALTLT